MLRAMEYAKDHDRITVNAVGNDVRRSSDHKLTGSATLV